MWASSAWESLANGLSIILNTPYAAAFAFAVLLKRVNILFIYETYI